MQELDLGTRLEVDLVGSLAEDVAGTVRVFDLSVNRSSG